MTEWLTDQTVNVTAMMLPHHIDQQVQPPAALIMVLDCIYTQKADRTCQMSEPADHEL